MSSTTPVDEPPEPLDWDDLPRLRPRVVRRLMRKGYPWHVAEEGCDRALAELFALNQAGVAVPLSWWFTRAWWRSEDVRLEMERIETAAQAMAERASSPDPECVAVDRARVERIRAHLSERDWTVLYLRAVERLREKEVAKRLDITVKQVEHAYRRARERASRFAVLVAGGLRRHRHGWRVVRHVAMWSSAGAAALQLALSPAPSTGAGAHPHVELAAKVIAARAPELRAPSSVQHGTPVATAAATVWHPRVAAAGTGRVSRTVVALSVGEHGTVGTGVSVDQRATGRSFVEEVVHCLDQGPSLDPRSAGCSD